MIINKIPGDEQITPLIEKQKELKKKTLILQTKINVVGNEISPLNNLKVQKNILLKQLLNAKINQDLENLDKHRYVEYSDKIKQIINQFQVRALNYHVKKLEKFHFEYFGDEPIYKNINTIKYLKNLKDVTIPPECFTDKDLIEIYKVHGRNLKIYDDILGDLIKNRKIKVK